MSPFVYGSASKTVLDRFDVVQTRAMRMCCGVFRTSPVSALLIEMGEMPLWLRRIKLGLQYWIKLSGCNYTYPARCLLELGNMVIYFLFVHQWAREMGLEQGGIAEHIGWSPMPYWDIPKLKIEFTFLQEKDKMEVIPRVVVYLNSINQSSIIIFTDGSRDPVNGRAGFGVYVEKLGLKIGKIISNGSSVLTTELLAIYGLYGGLKKLDRDMFLSVQTLQQLWKLLEQENLKFDLIL